jgi:uncharacterized protein YjbI with pentapeptide repeats
MQIIRPQQLVVLKGGYQLGRQSYLGVSVVAGCYLSKPAHLVNEAQIWHGWQQAPQSFSLLDAAEPKPNAEFLLAGHAGVGKPVSTLDVCVDVGSLSRHWRVQGDAQQPGMRIKPFLRMPLDHAQSFGGKGCAENPLGKGFGTNDCENLMPVNRLGDPQVRVPLTAPTPVAHNFALRKAYLDKIASQMSDRHYRENIFPGMPEQLDCRYYQMACPQQQLTTACWPEQVPYRLQGFLPDNQIIDGQFPAVQARAFCWKHGEMQEIALQRKTLWLLPDNDLGLIIYTGSVTLDHMLDESLSALLVGLEECAQPRSPEHYQQVYQRRSDPLSAPWEFLLDRQLMPEKREINVVDGVACHPSSLGYNPAPMSEQQVADYYQRIEQASALPQQVAAENVLPEVDWDSLPGEPQPEPFQLLGNDNQVIEDVTLTDGQWPREISHRTFRQCRFLGSQLAQCVFVNCCFEQCQFEQVSFSQASFHDVQWQQCTMVQVVWSQAKLHNSLFSQVTFEASHAEDFSAHDTEWQNCLFHQNYWRGASFTDVQFSGCLFSETHLTQSVFQGGQQQGCVWQTCQLQQNRYCATLLEKNSWLACVAQGSQFEKCQFTSITVGLQCDFSSSLFQGSHLQQVGFKALDLRFSRWLRCTISDGNLDQADLRQAHIEHCDLAGIRLQGSQLANSHWQGSSLQQGMLYDACLRDSHFERCNLAGANLAMSWQNQGSRFEHCLLDAVCWLPRRVTQGGVHTHE